MAFPRQLHDSSTPPPIAEVLDATTFAATTFTPNKGGVTLSSKALSSNGKTVTLTFSANPGTGGQTLTISAGTLEDINGNIYPGATLTIPN